jgi:hypothetical protein
MAARPFRVLLALRAFACDPAASSYNSCVAIADGELRFSGYMSAVSCAGAAQGYGIGVRASRRFAALNIGLNVLRLRGSMEPQFRTVLAARWSVAPGSLRHCTGPKP